MRKRKGLAKVGRKEKVAVPIGSGGALVQGYWASMIKSSFEGRRAIAVVKSKYMSGFYKLYWLEDKFHIGVVGPDKAPWICPVSPIHFKDADVPKLIANAQNGIFPTIRSRLLPGSGKAKRKRLL